MCERRSGQKGQCEKKAVACGFGSALAVGAILGCLPAEGKQHDRQGLRHGRCVLFCADGIVPEKSGHRVERAQQQSDPPVAGQVDDELIQQPKRQQRPQRGVGRQDGRGIGVLAEKRTHAMEPCPAAQSVERIAGRVARPSLHLRVLVGDQVAPLQLARPQAVVERQKIQN